MDRESRASDVFLLTLVFTGFLHGHVCCRKASTVKPAIECGKTPDIPVNVTFPSGEVAGIYAIGRQMECYSRLQRRGHSHLHIIFDVFGRDCGARDASNSSRSIHVRLNHIPALASPEDTVHVLTCYYSSPLVPTLGSNVARDFQAVERDKDVIDRNDRDFTLWKTGHRPGHRSPSLLEDRAIHQTSRSKNNGFPKLMTNHKDDVETSQRNRTLDGQGGVIFQDSAHRRGKPSDNVAKERALNRDKLSDNAKEGGSSNTYRLHRNDDLYQLQNDEFIRPSDENRQLLQGDATQTPRSTRKLPAHDTSSPLDQPSTSGMPLARSVLQLNVVDENGKLTEVVIPGKVVALEMHATNPAPFGTLQAMQCRVTNPLSSNDRNQGKLFSEIIVEKGCGLGDFLPRSAGFRRVKQGHLTPFFSIPPSWTKQASLLFSCDVVVCTDSNKCRQACPPSKDRVYAPGIGDVMVTLDSQLVAPCLLATDMKEHGLKEQGGAFMPECLQDGHILPTHIPPTVIEPWHNDTLQVSLPAASYVAPTFWLVHHLHYVIIICILGLLIVVFMFGTFCKMASMQRQVLRSNKLVAEARVAANVRDTHNQTTQTPRPLPRIPAGRSQGFSRRQGDGASTIVTVADDHHGIRPLSDSQLPPLENSQGASRPLSLNVSHAVTPAQCQTTVHATLPSPVQPQTTAVQAQTSTPTTSSMSSRSVYTTTATIEDGPERQLTSNSEVKNSDKLESAELNPGWTSHEHYLSKGSNPSSRSGTLERGVVLGINSLRRNIEASHQGGNSPSYYSYNMPAPCTEVPESHVNLGSRERSIPECNSFIGIRTGPRYCNRKGTGIMPVMQNGQEEITRL